MAFYTADGSKFYFSETFGTAKSITALTNASPAVATSAAHGLLDGDEVLLTSGWEEATENVFKVDQLTVDTFGLLGLDSTDTNFHPVGSGTGDVKKISTWVEMPQVMTIQTSGGDPRFIDVQLLASQYASRIPTGFNPVSATLTMAHDPSNAVYQQMLGISRIRKLVAFKIVVAGGGVSYGYGYLSAAEAPSLQSGQVNQVQVAMTFQKRIVSYGA
jgi:hypothetical protein